MKNFLFVLVVLFATCSIKGQSLYIKTFGNPASKPIIFLHGGPGYNSAGFEATTAKSFSEKGFFVIVYDRRGEGRSTDSMHNARFTFQQTFEDINTIYKKYHLKKASLIGHSFGGIIATLFAKEYPQSVRNIFLVSVPVSLQETFKTILTTSKQIYQTKNDSTNLRYIAMLEKMDTTSLEYASYCFAHAMGNGFYSPKKMTDEAKAIYSDFRKDPLIKYALQMSYEAPQGFWKTEKYTTIDLTKTLKELLSKNIKIYGLYGKDDGLYSAQQVLSLKSILGDKNLEYFDDCSHNVFIDQQKLFIQFITARDN